MSPRWRLLGSSLGLDENVYVAMPDARLGRTRPQMPRVRASQRIAGANISYFLLSAIRTQTRSNTNPIDTWHRTTTTTTQKQLTAGRSQCQCGSRTSKSQRLLLYRAGSAIFSALRKWKLFINHQRNGDWRSRSLEHRSKLLSID